MIKVVNTRPADRNQELTRLLRQAGFAVAEVPMVEVRADAEGQAKAAALQPSGFTGIFLSSPNGLRHFQEGLLASQFERWSIKPFYLVGPAARVLVETAGGRVAFVPQEASLEGFLKEFQTQPAPGLPLAQRWLHPCSTSTRLDPAEFRKKGITVVNQAVYRPACPDDIAARMAKDGKDAAAIVFCSGSAVENFFKSAPDLAAGLTKPKGPVAVSIGPSTSKALRDNGVTDIHQAQHADDLSLVDTLKSLSGGFKTEVLRQIASKPAAKPAPKEPSKEAPKDAPEAPKDAPEAPKAGPAETPKADSKAAAESAPGEAAEPAARDIPEHKP